MNFNYLLFKVIYTMLLLAVASLSYAQNGYTYEVAGGNVNNHGTTNTSFATMLVGGSEVGGDGEVNATQWFISKADGGDYLVLRTGGVSGQASWVWNNFGSQLSSAAELSIDTRSAANNATVAQYIRNAEAIFIAGGNQTEYVDYWKNTEVEDALNYLIHTKKVPIGGTSAGMSVMGGSYYAPATSGILTSEILDNPFHPNTNNSFFYNDFLDNPFLTNVITDTHLDRTHGSNNENRYGRMFGFLARIVEDQNSLTRYAIGCDEATFVCIDDTGIAKVFGDGGNTQYPTKAYFAQVNCEAPETITSGSPLVWNQDNVAVKVYVIQGSTNGNGNSFDLNNWSSATGGGWMPWYTTGGYNGFNYINGSGASTSANPPTCSGGGGSTDYCTSSGNSTSYEYIDEVKIGSISNVSGNDGGFGDYTSFNFNLNAGSSYTMTIYPETSDREVFIAWIDFNQDGDFEDSNEEVLYKVSRRRARGTISIPSTALSGTTRMRVSIKYEGDGDPTSCEHFSYGEVEDYSIIINGGASSRAKETENHTFSINQSMTVYPNPGKGNFKLSIPSGESAKLIVYDLTGRKIIDKEGVEVDLSSQKAGMYLLKVIYKGTNKTFRLIKE